MVARSVQGDKVVSRWMQPDGTINYNVEMVLGDYASLVSSVAKEGIRHYCETGQQWSGGSPPRSRG